MVFSGDYLVSFLGVLDGCCYGDSNDFFFFFLYRISGMHTIETP